MLGLPDPPPRRRPGLTPMIDVVFLLLVFFMLAARFGIEGAVPLSTAGAGAAVWSGPPRLIDLGADLRLNGVPVAAADIADRLRPLMEAPDDAVLVRARAGASVQDLVTLTDLLRAAGITRLLILD